MSQPITDHELVKHMSAKLKLSRKSLGLSRRDVAKKCSFSLSTLRRIEECETPHIPITHVIELCRLYRLPLAELTAEPVDKHKDIIRELAAVSIGLSEKHLRVVYSMISDLVSSESN